MDNKSIIEVLENRKAILKAAIEDDTACFKDPFLCQHMRGRVAVEERWLEETERLIAALQK